MIFTTVGVTRGFDRLIKVVDEVSSETSEHFITQVGKSVYKPDHCSWFRFMNWSDYLTIYNDADLVIGHAGTGTLLTAAEHNKKIILFPRNREEDDVMDNHQHHHLSGWSKNLDLTVANSKSEIQYYLDNRSKVTQVKGGQSGGLGATLRDIVLEEASSIRK